MEAETRGEYVLLEIGRRGRVREPSLTIWEVPYGRQMVGVDRERERDKKMLHGIRNTVGSEFLCRKLVWFFDCM
jgi:hypothetical protein